MPDRFGFIVYLAEGLFPLAIFPLGRVEECVESEPERPTPGRLTPSAPEGVKKFRTTPSPALRDRRRLWTLIKRSPLSPAGARELKLMFTFPLAPTGRGARGEGAVRSFRNSIFSHSQEGVLRKSK